MYPALGMTRPHPVLLLEGEGLQEEDISMHKSQISARNIRALCGQGGYGPSFVSSNVLRIITHFFM